MNADLLKVYFIMGTINCKKDPLQTLKEALEAGITCFQLREKGEGALTGTAYEEFAYACQKMCQRYQIPFIINDDVELALKLNADGIHIGQEDLSLPAFRERAKGKIVGVSVHNIEEMELAILNGADYVGIGPIYKTQTKKDAKPPAGLHFLSTIRKQFVTFPIVGIGGITEENASIVRSSGADGVSVISTICDSTDIRRTVEKLQ
ncbi:thiamine phosphate synthase [Desemzia sp. RIT804]|uniref:thiamine phosphate synthase n=1 Tax=Desemzia sp. RIT 804 TaxID=2810209 RepID=UPI0019519FB1|nr:thiamine phosphate synthase [Desemzia sp. RIT 804]MBM6615512.1 thiamine phosphate synthase [Desemzia sp. RIT 804]